MTRILLATALVVATVLEPAMAQQRAPAGAPEAVPSPITLTPALDRVLRDYERAWRDGNGPDLAALFTDDGFAVQSGSPIKQGRAAIAQGITRPGGRFVLALRMGADGRGQIAADLDNSGPRP